MNTRVYSSMDPEMDMIRGKVHKNLNMNLDYNIKVQANSITLGYIKEISDWFEKIEPKSSSTKSSASPLELFLVDEDFETLSKENQRPSTSS